MASAVVKRSDVSEFLLLQACEWFHDGTVEWTPDETLVEWYPSKVILARMEQLQDQGLLEVGVSLRTAWLSDKGKKRLEELSRGPNGVA
jgi:hypothetical protein